MTLTVFQICKPTNALHADKFFAVVVNATSRRLQRIRIGHVKFSVAAMNACPQPNFIFLNQRENFFVGDAVDVADYQKIFVRVHNPREKFSEQTEGRVGNNYVCLVAQFLDFVGTKISVPFKIIKIYGFFLVTFCLD